MSDAAKKESKTMEENSLLNQTTNDGSAERHGTWQKTFSKSKDAWIKTEQHASRLQTFGVFEPSSIDQRTEFVVDSGASMHSLSRKGLNSAELVTVRVSRTPSEVITANGEVQANDEATVYVKDLDLFATVPRSRTELISARSTA